MNRFLKTVANTRDALHFTTTIQSYMRLISFHVSKARLAIGAYC